MKISAKKMVQRLTDEGVTLIVIARNVGSSQSSVSRWKDGFTEPRGRNLDKLRELYFERFPDDNPEAPARSSSGELVDQATGDVPNLTIHGGMGNAGVQQITLADGEGGSRINPAYLAGFWSFPSQVRSALGDLSTIQALPSRGDSMEPTIANNSVLFIDTAHNYPSPPDIYAVDYGDGLVFKRIELIPQTNKVRIISDNPRYSPHEIRRDHLHVYGRVVAWFQWRG